jgi:hypothetical protein
MEKRHSLRELRQKQERLIEATYREMKLPDLAGQFDRHRHRVIRHTKPRYRPRTAGK